jgi:hypothetical protein
MSEIHHNAEKVDADNGASHSWVRGNIVNPLLNEFLRTPGNIIVDATNLVGEAIGHGPVLDKIDRWKTADTSNSSINYWTQVVTGGVASALMYAAIGKFGAGGSRMLARGLDAQRPLLGIQPGTSMSSASLALTNFLSRESVGQVIGAAAFDCARHPEEGQTRFGNMLGGAASFSLYGLANPRLANMSTLGQWGTRYAIGLAGSVVQDGAGWLGGNELQLNSTSLNTAGVMNLVLPGAQRWMGRAVDFAATRRNAGIPVERAANYSGLSGLSPELDRLIGQTAQARVRTSQSGNFEDVRARMVNLETTPGDLSTYGAQLGHALRHIQSERAGEHEGLFRQARQALLGGDNNGAWQAFRQARLFEESNALAVEASIKQQLDKRLGVNSSTAASWPSEAEIARRTIPHSGISYEESWRREFAERFVPSAGQYRPEMDFSWFSRFKGTTGGAAPEGSEERLKVQRSWRPKEAVASGSRKADGGKQQGGSSGNDQGKGAGNAGDRPSQPGRGQAQPGQGAGQPGDGQANGHGSPTSSDSPQSRGATPSPLAHSVFKLGKEKGRQGQGKSKGQAEAESEGQSASGDGSGSATHRVPGSGGGGGDDAGDLPFVNKPQQPGNANAQVDRAPPKLENKPPQPVGDRENTSPAFVPEPEKRTVVETDYDNLRPESAPRSYHRNADGASAAFDLNEAAARRQAKVANAFSVVVAKMAEDLSGKIIHGHDEWNVAELPMRKYEGKMLDDCMYSRERESAVLVLDTSGSCSQQAKFYQQIGRLAAARGDLEMYEAPNADFQRKWDPAKKEWVTLPVREYIDEDGDRMRGFVQPKLKGRSIIFFGDFDGQAAILSWVRNYNRVYWLNPNAGHNPEVAEEFARANGKMFQVTDDDEFIATAKQLR